MRFPVALFALLMLAPLPARAVQPDEVLRDPGLEARARSLSEELRCLVCQNQSIDDSAAPLARDLRLLVRERLQAGDSDAEVKRYLVARFGDFVLLKPPFSTETLLLWLTPPAVFLLGGVAILVSRRKRPAKAEALEPAEQARLDALLEGDEPSSQPVDRPHAAQRRGGPGVRPIKVGRSPVPGSAWPSRNDG